MPKIPTLYLASGESFSAGQQLHNLMLEKYLRERGYECILPQRRRHQFWDPEKGSYDYLAFMEDCIPLCRNPENICVARVEREHTNSGGRTTELALAVGGTGRAIVYCTDDRTYILPNTGLDAMLRQSNVFWFSVPAALNELENVDEWYGRLAEKIDDAVQNILKKG